MRRRGWCLVSLVMLLSLSMPSGAQVITTVAGGFVGDGGQATGAALAFPEFTAMDAGGNLFISDIFHQRIRKVTPSGDISTFVGDGIAGFSGDGGPAIAARLNGPTGIVLDPSGNLIIADQGNGIRKVNTLGVITTIAGNGTRGYSGDGGPATAASLNNPWGLALDLSGNLFFSDISNQVIRKIDSTGTITTVAGTGTAGFNGDGIAATSARLNFPRGVVLDALGNLFIADTLNHRVRRVDHATGIITTVAGTGLPNGPLGDGGLAIAARVPRPRGVVFDSSGNLLITAQNRVRKVDSAGIITTIAGAAGGGFNGDGDLANSTAIFAPTGMLFDPGGNLFLADSGNGRIRKIDGSRQLVTTVAGGFVGDGNLATSADLNLPENLTVDSVGRILIADSFHFRVRKVDISKVITTLAGNGTTGFSGDFGPATSAQLGSAIGLAQNSGGNTFIADPWHCAIRKVDPSGTITTFFEDPFCAAEAENLALDPSSTSLYFSDALNCLVWRLDISGSSLTRVAGTPGICGFFGDNGAAASARLDLSTGYTALTFDSSGNLYIADTGNHRIRKVDISGIITTVAGTGTCGFSGDGGAATAAQLCNPYGVAVDASGNMYIGDYTNQRIRLIENNGSGTINTVAGTGADVGFNGDRAARDAALSGPIALATDSLGNLYLADDSSYLIRKITFGPIQSVIALSDLVDAFQLAPGIAGSLKAKLADAKKLIQKGNNKGAKGKLQDFINEVNALRAKALTQAQAEQLIAVAQEIISMI